MINLNGKNYKLYYLDTCALSEMVKDKAGFGSNLLNLVLSDGIIALSSYSLWELKSSPVVYKDVIEVITSLPAALLKDDKSLVEAEYKLLTNQIKSLDPIGSYLLNTKTFKISQLINSLITNEKKDIFKKSIEDVNKIVGAKPSIIFSTDDLTSKKTSKKA